MLKGANLLGGDKMYTPVTAVWEITMGCNMRCKHCGSSCTSPLKDELTTSEAIGLCDQLKEIGLKYITLSGGEPTTRKDWDVIAKRLIDNKIKTSIITNGWNIDDFFVEKVGNIGLESIAISIDGTKETHDYIRKPFAFDKSVLAIEKLVANNIKTSIITSINTRNINELNELYKLFSDLGVYSWQLQIAQPMGIFSSHNELLLQPSRIVDIIDFAYEKIGSSPLIVLADCIGYYSKKSIAVNENFLQEGWSWNGCGAGKHVIGILQNGDIIGCTSVRNREFVAGNIRKRLLADIWNDEEVFKWNRKLTVEDLGGFCKKCIYNSRCLGGCSNSSLCMNGSMNSENVYCVYNQEYRRFCRYIDNLDNGELEQLKSRYHNNNNFIEAINDRLCKGGA